MEPSKRRTSPPRSTRRFARFSVTGSAVVHTVQEDFPCAVEDMSRSGVRLSGPLPEPLERIVDLTLRGVRNEPEVRVRARASRSIAGPTGRQAAFEYLDVAPDQRRGIERMVERGVPVHPPGAVSLDALRPGAPPLEVRAALDAIPLARRISLAARAGKKERDALRHDTNPTVLDALAHNADLSLAEARALAASTHLQGSTLEALANDSRWVKDAELRLAIIAHPKTPQPLAERLLGEADLASLRRLLRRPGLPAGVRDRIVRRNARGH